MNSLHNTVSSLWNATLSSFPATAKYCEHNNINWTTTGKLAKDLGGKAVSGTQAIVAAIPGVALAAKDLAVQTAHTLDHGCSMFMSGWNTLSGKATEIGAEVWTGLKVQAPALGMALLDDVQHLTGMGAATAREDHAGSAGFFDAEAASVSVVDDGYAMEDDAMDDLPEVQAYAQAPVIPADI